MFNVKPKRLSVFFVLILSSLTLAAVSTKVRFSDSNIPLELADSNVPNVYREIMTGTKLSITVESNEAVYWGGLLLLEDEMRDFGQIYGRGYDGFFYYSDSVLEDAGDPFIAFVGDFADSNFNGKEVEGLQLETATDDEFSMPPVQAGEWFIVDYNAVEPNDCNIAFHWVQPGDVGTNDHLYDIQLKQVKTSDFDDSYKVDFEDFAILSYYWDSNCVGPDWCGGADLDDTNYIDINDLYLFSEHWLDINR